MALIKKVADLLGEELSKQVEEKLGTVELAVMNDGTVVKAEKHETLKTEYGDLQTKYDKDIKEINEKLATAIADSKDIETLKQTLETVKGESKTLTDDLQNQLSDVKKVSAVKVDLIKEKAKDIVGIMAHIDMKKVSMDGDNLIGYTEQRDKIKADFPFQFGEDVQKGTDPHKNGDPNKERKNPWSKEHYNLTEQGRIVREDPSLAEQMKNNI